MGSEPGCHKTTAWISRWWLNHPLKITTLCSQIGSFPWKFRLKLKKSSKPQASFQIITLTSWWSNRLIKQTLVEIPLETINHQQCEFRRASDLFLFLTFFDYLAELGGNNWPKINCQLSHEKDPLNFHWILVVEFRDLKIIYYNPLPS